MKKRRRVARPVRTTRGRRKKGIIARFLETVSGIVLIPLVIYAATNLNKMPLPAHGESEKEQTITESVETTGDIAPQPEEALVEEAVEASPEKKETSSEETAPVTETKEKDAEEPKGDKAEVAVNGSTSWHRYVQTEEQRSVQKVIKRIAEKHNVNWKMAYAICLKESRCNPHLDCSAQYGLCDNGQSFGPWQIYRPQAKGITVLQAEDFEWSTEWSIARLKRHEPLGEYEQIRSHNGLYDDYRNTGYVEDVQKLMSIL